MSTLPPTGSTYGDLQNEERFKKLERTLKYLLIQRKQQKTTNLNNWPSVSSINGDALDTSVVFSPHSSRVGSEVLASSRDMRKIIHGRPRPAGLPKMATSSVKHFPAGTPEERVLMPPPSSIGILAQCSRKSSLFGAAKATPGSAERNHGSAQSVISSIKYSSAAKDTSQIEFERESTEHSETIAEDKPSRIFSKWRPMLNDKGQLIIKGTLECGKVARSKPVIRRLSVTSVQSIFKHIYHLRGNICDERGELPDYIRGKFFGGFPDDWENVYQVWSNYVAGGCRDGFRWPTPVADSDDDLKSEVTDVTVQKPRRRLLRDKNVAAEKVLLSPPRHPYATRAPKEHSVQPPEEKSSPRKRPHSSREQNQPVSDETHQNSGKERPQLAADQYNEDSNHHCVTCNRSRAAPAEEANDTIDNFIERVKRQQLNASLCSTSSLRPTVTSLKDIIHEDKLQIILENLTSKNCSIEYIDKIIEMFDCLKYVVSYKSEDPGSEPRPPSRTPSCFHGAPRRDTPYPPPRQSPEKPKNSTEAINNKTYVTRKQAVRRKLSSRDYESSDTYENSEDERYAPAQLPRTRERPPRHKRPKEVRHCRDVSDSEEELPPPRRKSPHYDAHPVANNPRRNARAEPAQRLVSYDSSVSFSEDERRSLKPRETYDSSVSITEDEFGSQRRSEAKKILQEVNAKVVQVSESSTRPTKEVVKAQHQDSQPERPKGFKSADANHPNDNKENEKSREETTQQKSPKSSSAERAKRKPTVVSVEKVSISIPPVKSALPGSSNTAHPEELTKTLISTATSSANSRDEAKGKLHNPAKEKDPKRPPPSKNAEKASKKGKFGTELNPKLLTSWVPKLWKKTDESYGLVFEGKLLNEAGHVESRRFSTSFIERRTSPQIVETEAHEFYELVGDLCDTKHTVPRELQKLCFNGCPARIAKFCERWRRLIEEEEEARRQSLNTTTVDMMSVPTSSRGRRILPPLSYWTGERVVLKDNTPVYTPGTSQESTISSLEASFRRDLSQNSSRKKDTSGKDTSVNSGHNTSKKEGNNQKEERSVKSKKTPPDADTAKKPPRPKLPKRRSARDIHEDSSDHEEPEVALKPKRRRQRTDAISPAKRIKAKDDEKAKLPTRSPKTRSGVTCTLHRNVPYRDDILSDDQPSLV